MSSTANSSSLGSQTTLTPLPYHLIVTLDEPETQVGRIILPDTARKEATTALVHLHGPGALEDLTGRRVVLEKWNWRQFVLNEHTFHVVPEAAVLAVFEEEKPSD
jgi:co-chaperonin GroES (HSP10)